MVYHIGMARKWPGADLNAISDKCVSTSRTVESGDNQTAIRFGELQTANEIAQNNFSGPVADILPYSGEIDTVLGTNQQNQLTSAFEPSLALEEWPQLDSLELELESPSTSAFKPPSMSSDSHESYSCPRESYEIFRDLICPSPFLHAPESNSVTVSAQLDQVLYFNRNAINRLSKLLACPYAKSGHRAMVHASIVSRILIWYQQAAGWTGSSSWGPCSSALADSSTSYRMSSSSSSSPPSRTEAGISTISLPSLVQVTGFAVEHVPVSMGSFCIGDQNVQAAVRYQLILSELKKTGTLIDSFISLGSGESSVSGVTSLYSYLGVWLRTELAGIVRTLRSRLHALDENLES